MENLIYSVGAAIIGLGLLIVFHEFGHFLLAKLCGVGVLTFAVRSGLNLWITKKGESEYALSYFLIGGYVKRVGEDPDEEVRSEDVEKSFAHKSLLKRIAIVVAGPGFNLLLALFLLMIVFTFYGVPVMSTQVSGVEKGSPAERAGIVKGDRIVAIDGKPVKEWDELSKTIKASGGKPLNLQISRGSETVSLTVQPIQKEGRTVFGERKDDWIIGIGSQVSIEKGNPGLAVVRAFYQTYDYSKLTLVALFKMISGDVSPRNIGGPILIAQMAGQQAQEGLGSFLAFLAGFSIKFGGVQFFAGPGLDGGHFLFFFVQAGMPKP